MKPFDNKLVRQAINYALNPHVMLKHIYDGHGAVVNGPLGSNWIGFDPQRQRGLRSGRRSVEQGRHQSRVGAAGVRHLLGQGRRQRRQAAVTTPAAMAATPISKNTFVPAVPSASTTTIRNSTSSSTRSNAPAITRSASRFSIKPAAFSWQTYRSRRFISSRSFTV